MVGAAAGLVKDLMIPLDASRFLVEAAIPAVIVIRFWN
jgi:hypothetical protein